MGEYVKRGSAVISTSIAMHGSSHTIFACSMSKMTNLESE